MRHGFAQLNRIVRAELSNSFGRTGRFSFSLYYLLDAQALEIARDKLAYAEAEKTRMGTRLERISAADNTCVNALKVKVR